MRLLKTIVKGKAKAATAGLGYSGVIYSAAWNALVTNVERSQIIVNAQMKHNHLVVRSSNRMTTMKYAQLITTCVKVLKQFTGDLYSESFPNSAYRNFPDEMKTKRCFLAKSKGYYH